MSQVQKPSVGRIVRYVGYKGDIVAGLVTAVMGESQVNLFLFNDGLTQAHLPTHAYEVDYAPIDPTGHPLGPNTWHWPERA